jgi:hypothetical protein
MAASEMCDCLRNLDKRLAANLHILQEFFKSVMAYSRVAFKPANSDLDNLFLDFVACHYLFRALVLERWHAPCNPCSIVIRQTVIRQSIVTAKAGR